MEIDFLKNNSQIVTVFQNANTNFDHVRLLFTCMKNPLTFSLKYFVLHLYRRFVPRRVFWLFGNVE